MIKSNAYLRSSAVFPGKSVFCCPSRWRHKNRVSLQLRTLTYIERISRNPKGLLWGKAQDRSSTLAVR